MREILPPAERILQHSRGNPSPNDQGRLTVPSRLYDDLRATLVQAELVLLRVLGFELRLPLPLDYLARYLERAMQPYSIAAEDYDSWSGEERAEYGIVGNVMETNLGRRSRDRAVEAYGSSCASLNLC